MLGVLAHVGVRTSNLEKSIRFWRDALSLQVVDQTKTRYDLPDGYHIFRVFHLRGKPGPPYVNGLLDYLHIGVRVPNVQEAAQRCEALGFQIIWDGVDSGKPYDPSSPPSESFKVEDPDGIVVDITASDDQWPGIVPREGEDR
jgi:catechol 2,3-dioxygenase-like lactoylglutathione lyase family enzyme